MKKFLCFLLILALLTPAALAANGDTLVYITRTGECYHMDGCSYLRSRIEVTLQEAVDRGYRACSRCGPPRLSNRTTDADSTSSMRSVLDDIIAGNTPSVSVSDRHISNLDDVVNRATQSSAPSTKELSRDKDDGFSISDFFSGLPVFVQILVFLAVCPPFSLILWSYAINLFKKNRHK